MFLSRRWCALRMAHRNTLEPAVLDLKFTVASGDKYIDIAKELSKVNRRLYRQGKTYYVGGVTLCLPGSLDPGTPASLVRIYAAPNSWVVHNAWKKAFAAWKRQQRDALKATSPGAAGTWADFKVYLDDHARANASGVPLTTIDGDGDAIKAGDWNYSQILDATDDAAHTVRERYLHLLGEDVSTTDWGVVKQYQNSRATVSSDDPSLPSAASYSMYALIEADHTEVTDEVIDNMEYDNDVPPYDPDEYPGGNSNAECAHEMAIGSTAGGLGATKGFQAPCGLIMITAAAAVEVTLHLMPGNYRGVAATPMGQ